MRWVTGGSGAVRPSSNSGTTCARGGAKTVRNLSTWAETRRVGFEGFVEAVCYWKYWSGESGFEPPTPWSRTRFQSLLKFGEVVGS